MWQNIIINPMALTSLLPSTLPSLLISLKNVLLGGSTSSTSLYYISLLSGLWNKSSSWAINYSTRPRTHYLVTLNSFLGVKLSDAISLNSQWGRELTIKLMTIPSPSGPSVTGVKINSNVHHHCRSKNQIDKNTTSMMILTDIMFIFLTIIIISIIGKRRGWIDKRIINVFFYSRLSWIVEKRGRC